MRFLDARQCPRGRAHQSEEAIKKQAPEEDAKVRREPSGSKPPGPGLSGGFGWGGQRDAAGNLEQLETHAHKGSRKVVYSVLSKASPRSKSCFHSQEERNTGEANIEPARSPRDSSGSEHTVKPPELAPLPCGLTRVPSPSLMAQRLQPPSPSSPRPIRTQTQTHGPAPQRCKTQCGEGPDPGPACLPRHPQIHSLWAAHLHSPILRPVE